MFFGWTFHTVWEFILSSATLSTLIGVAAVAVAVLVPPWLARFVPNLRTVAVYTAVAAFSYSFVAGKFYNDGIQVKQTEWNKAIAAEAGNGEAARDDAVASVPAVTADRSVYAKDPWNRNRRADGQQPAGRTKGPLRWLEGH